MTEETTTEATTDDDSSLTDHGKTMKRLRESENPGDRICHAWLQAIPEGSHYRDIEAAIVGLVVGVCNVTGASVSDFGEKLKVIGRQERIDSGSIFDSLISIGIILVSKAIAEKGADLGKEASAKEPKADPDARLASDSPATA